MFFLQKRGSSNPSHLISKKMILWLCVVRVLRFHVKAPPPFGPCYLHLPSLFLVRHGSGAAIGGIAMMSGRQGSDQLKDHHWEPIANASL